MGKWGMVKLGDVAEITNGYAFDSKHFNDMGNGMPLIRIRDVVRGFSETYTTEQYSNNYVIRNGDLLIGMDGEFNISPWNSIDALLNQRVCKIVANTHHLLNRYLYYYLPKALKEIEEATPFVTVKHLSSKKIVSIELPLPPLPVQQQIADVLDHASALIEKRKAQIEKLDLLVKSQFIEIFGDPVTNHLGWKKEKLGSLLLVEPQNGFYRPQSDYRSDGSGVPILRIDAFYNGRVTDWFNLKRLTCTDSEKERYLLRKGDIVINRVNSIEYLGKCALIEGFFEDTVFESNMMRFHAKDEKLVPVYLTYFLCLPYVYNQIIAHAKKSVNQASINQKDVQDFDILVPPIALQTRFADFVHQVEAQKALLQASLQKLEQNYNSLMQKCFRGELF